MDKVDLLFKTRRHWSDFQINLLILLIHKVEKQDTIFKPYILKAKDVLVKKLSFEELKSETQSFLFPVHEIRTGNKLIQLPLFSSITFVIGEGIIEIRLHSIFKMYFLELKENYTLITLKNLLKFKSIFSKKLYLLIKKSDEIVTVLTIDQLKKQFSLVESYRDYNTFKKRVILQSQKELHNTDLAFSFEEIKKGRKVNAIQFKQIELYHILLSVEQKKIQKKLIKETRITDIQAKKIVIKFMPQEIYSILFLIKKAEYSGQIKTSITAYTVSVFNRILSQKN